MPALFVLANSLVDYLKSAVAPWIFKLPVLDEERGAPQRVLDERYDTVPVVICGFLLLAKWKECCVSREGWLPHLFATLSHWLPQR